ncbi:TnsA endonuclease N-terminal domain-containing protein [Acidovorax sp.]|uniref:TnsA endonuclease N-terminal domain-containing protein n=1 Tax=Acidovorax sp. TaxID=1872122 RepID=UPI00391F7A2F
MDNIDIREQFPLDRDITLEIACELGVPHPYYPTTHVPCVMTLDFLVTRIIDGKEAYFAYSVKTQKDLNDPKVVERMEIERTFCAMAGMTYFLIISDRIPHNKVKNLFWIRQAQIDPEESDSLRMFFEEHQMRMTNDLTHTQFQGSLVDYCTKYDQRCSVSAGTGLRVARMLLANRTMSMDLTNATPERAPLSTFRVTALPGRLRSMGGA